MDRFVTCDTLNDNNIKSFQMPNISLTIWNEVKSNPLKSITAALLDRFQNILDYWKTKAQYKLCNSHYQRVGMEMMGRHADEGKYTYCTVYTIEW